MKIFGIPNNLKDRCTILEMDLIKLLNGVIYDRKSLGRLNFNVDRVSDRHRNDFYNPKGSFP